MAQPDGMSILQVYTGASTNDLHSSLDNLSGRRLCTRSPRRWRVSGRMERFGVDCVYASSRQRASQYTCTMYPRTQATTRGLQSYVFFCHSMFPESHWALPAASEKIPWHLRPQPCNAIDGGAATTTFTSYTNARTHEYSDKGSMRSRLTSALRVQTPSPQDPALLLYQPS